MTDHELTRRDALTALGVAGLGATGVGALTWETLDGATEEGEDPPLGDHERRTLETLAGVLYPSEVSGIPDFLETYVLGRAREDPARARGIADAIARLDEYTNVWYESDYVNLRPSNHEDVLEEMGLSETDPDPEGGDAERVRFYLVNELLFALYATPTGGELVGLENPQGFPGGVESYQRGP
jgi:hypothetical protein